ncbi:MAG: RnfABCDGE type electron transport complex subunit G [Leptospirillia bacterium]
MSRMAMTLMAVCIVGAVILAFVNRVTEGPIAEEKRREVLRALDSVLPPHTNSPDQDTREITTDDGKVITLYLARQRDRVVGTALQVTAPDGYSGNIGVMVGVDNNGSILGVRILSHAETPGLGDKMVTDSTWLPAFRGRNLANTEWAVKKDGGDIDQFTGATITPRAVVGAVKQGLEVCAKFCR